MNRILVIRGGALGDFILTLPAIKLLRDAYPSARLEILGYKHIVALAEQRFYADAVCSIEYAGLASFFARDAALPDDLKDYFASFDLVVSYLFDPDGIFAANLKRCGGARLITGPAKFGLHKHATLELAHPLQELGLTLYDPAAHIFPNEQDNEAAASWISSVSPPFLALHPGSGSVAKNWPLDRWAALGRSRQRFLAIAGEADDDALVFLRDAWKGLPVTYVINQPLTTVSAVLAKCACFVGHDSGISHLAAAVGASCVLLFGPTDPARWAPLNERVRILRACEQTMPAIGVEEVREALNYELMRMGIST
ncbi:MAG: glycosyltransferase family 9 protein [Chthoniobacterales bacterium]